MRESIEKSLRKGGVMGEANVVKWRRKKLAIDAGPSTLFPQLSTHSSYSFPKHSSPLL